MDILLLYKETSSGVGCNLRMHDKHVGTYAQWSAIGVQREDVLGFDPPENLPAIACKPP
jgi:hypothetical protein